MLCPGSTVVHEGWMFNEVMLSKKGATFTFCTRCKARTFLNTWEPDWGYSYHQVIHQWQGEVDVALPRKIQFEAEEQQRLLREARERVGR